MREPKFHTIIYDNNTEYISDCCNFVTHKKTLAGIHFFMCEKCFGLCHPKKKMAAATNKT